MKAIINLQTSNSSYKKFNGLTFPVTEFLDNIVALKGPSEEFPENSVDFSFKEVIIVDIQEEYEKIQSRLEFYQRHRLDGDIMLESYKRKFKNINKYLEVHKIKLPNA